MSSKPVPAKKTNVVLAPGTKEHFIWVLKLRSENRPVKQSSQMVVRPDELDYIMKVLEMERRGVIRCFRGTIWYEKAIGLQKGRGTNPSFIDVPADRLENSKSNKKSKGGASESRFSKGLMTIQEDQEEDQEETRDISFKNNRKMAMLSPSDEAKRAKFSERIKEIEEGKGKPELKSYYEAVLNGINQKEKEQKEKSERSWERAQKQKEARMILEQEKRVKRNEEEIRKMEKQIEKQELEEAKRKKEKERKNEEEKAKANQLQNQRNQLIQKEMRPKHIPRIIAWNDERILDAPVAFKDMAETSLDLIKEGFDPSSQTLKEARTMSINYFDSFFPPSITSLVCNSKKTKKTGWKSLKWKRISKIYSRFNSVIVDFAKETPVQLTSEKQATNESMLMAFRVICRSNKELLKVLFGNQGFNSEGVYFVNVSLHYD